MADWERLGASELGAMADRVVLGRAGARDLEGSSAVLQQLARRAGVGVGPMVVGESSREKVPSSRLDLSKTGMWGSMPWSCTSHCSIFAEP